MSNMSMNDQASDKEDDLLHYVRQLPKVELHAHLNGCIRESTLFDLANERSATLSSHHFGSTDVDASSTTPTDEDTGQDHFMYNVLPRSLQDCFDMFAEIPNCVNDLPALKRITLEALEDFASHHVVYLELRSTPKRLLASHVDDDKVVTTKRDYVEVVLQVLNEFETREQQRYQQEISDRQDASVRLPMVCRFIVAVDRSQTQQDASENVNLAIEFFQKEESGMVVGVDLGGNPTKQDFRDFQPVFQRARDAGLQVTIHCAEVPCGDDDSMNETQSIIRAREEAAAILNFRPDRLGHALLLSPSLQATLDKLRIPVETCPTSNVMTLELAKLADGNLIHGLHQHPALHHWLRMNHPLAVGTDDPGVFDTTATKELLLIAAACKVDRIRLASLVLNSMDYAFCDLLTREKIKERMVQRIEELGREKSALEIS
jgi:adenosine deaminase